MTIDPEMFRPDVVQIRDKHTYSVRLHPAAMPMFWYLGDRLYRALISFANAKSDEQQAAKKYFDTLLPVKRKRAFYSVGTEARQLVHSALEELVEHGELKRKTRKVINDLQVPFRGQNRLTESGVEMSIEQEFPNLAYVCAYGIVRLIGTELDQNILRCRLSECRRFFWAPRKRGPRPSYCCNKHRNRGAKRTERGMRP